MDLAGSPESMGAAHGQTYGEEIRHYTKDRVELVSSGLWSGGPMSQSDVLDIAESCIAKHESFSPSLHQEMLAMADAAGITPAEAIVVGGFTDFVDTVRAAVGGPHPDTVVEDDCTAFIVPDRRASGQGYFGQTWDMHDTATDHVVLLRVKPSEGPSAVVFTTVGCVGQIGMNELGVCVGINNLIGSDGQVGVTWPLVVREMLIQETATDALDILLDAELAGAHNYLIFDAEGIGFNVEGMPSVRPVTPLGDDPLVHTNHTTYEATSAIEADRTHELQVNSRDRLELANELLAEGDIDEQRLMELTREPSTICRRGTEPYHLESSGAAIMRPKSGDFWACWGIPADNEYEHVALVGAGNA